jgi:hypothetical protein
MQLNLMGIRRPYRALGIAYKMIGMMMVRWLLLLLVFLPGLVLAEVAMPPVASVEDNIRAMDADRDGMVTATEIRVFLEARHGKGYRRELLDEMEIKAGAKSCASPFSRSQF